MSKKKKKYEKKKYYLMYLRNRLIAIAKDKETIREYITDRYREIELVNLDIRKKKLNTIAEEYEDFIKRRHTKSGDVVESVKERRYRNLLREEAKDEIKKQKKKMEKLKKLFSKKKVDKNDLRLKIEDCRYTIDDLKRIDETITARILDDDPDIDEYLKSNEILEMIARGDI